MIQDVKRKIRKVVRINDYEKGLIYDEDSVSLQSIDERADSRVFHFVIRSERTYRFYRVEIVVGDNDISRTFCTCPQFISTHSCKHVAASLILYSHEIFQEGKENRFLIQSKNFLNHNANVIQKKIRKRLFLEIYIDELGYYYTSYQLTLKIGDDHFYTVRNKFYDFKSAYFDFNDQVEFGKFLTYSSSDYYFSKEDEQFLEFLFDWDETHNSFDRFSERDIKKLLEQLENRPFYFNHVFVAKVECESPIQYSLKKKEDYYCFSHDEVTPITSDYSYVLKEKKVYHLPSRERKLLSELKQAGLKEVLFEQEDIINFEKAILPVVKNQLVLDKSVEEIQLIKEPEVKLYFDFEDIITCNLCFLYGEEELSYFEQKENLLRDIEFENQVLSDLYAYSFQVTHQKIWLDDIDRIGDFLEHGLEELSQKYEVLTSSKMKNTQVLKEKRIMSTFSIGKDNIMSYSFELEDASKKDLEKILVSLKQKKKYYKMKNGNLLSLENKEMQELETLTEELDLDMNGGVIPKYRALYLDSIKNHYHIIKTDDLFGKFIENFKNYQNLELSFEDDILRSYQRIGVKWLYHIYKCDFGGILADEMGLGKSIQVIYFIKELLKENKEHQVLIVVPTSLVYNWKNEFDKFGSTISYEIIAGNKKTRQKLLESHKNVYITSYGLLREDIEWYQEKHFKVCIIDEAQNIKNMTTGITKAVKKVPCDIRFALTGTPIENSALELYSIFDFIMPGFLGSFLSFQGKYKIKEFDEQTNQLLTGLNQIISPFILRRKKTDVMKELPQKLENNIFIDLNEPQRKLYAAEVEYIQKEMDRLIQEEGFQKANFLILKLLTRLRQLCIDPKIMFEDYQGGSSKIEELIKVIKESILNGHKILLFTSFKTALDIVKKEFEKEKITSYQIDGSVPSKKRMELVEQFNQDDTNVFLIMLKAGGTGLNLTSADVVIHLDLWWNPQAENQATDRAHRIGQTKVVQVIKLISRGTIEERILELQKKKKELSDKIIEGENRGQNLLSSLTEEDIRHLLSFENKED